MHRQTALWLVCLTAVLTALALSVAPAVADVSPPTVSETLAPGESITITKEVDVPEVPPKLDFVLDVDLSGSYADDIVNINALAPDLWDDLAAGVPDLQGGLVTFVDYPYENWGFAGTGDYAYARDQDLTNDKTTWTSAVNAMTIRFGVDEPESQFESLYQAATGAGRDVGDPGASLGDIAAGLGVSFRADATKVIAITTDASFHTPGDSMCVAPAPCPFGYPGPSQADTITALTAAGIKVIALKAPGSGGEMDALAAATGGSVQTTSSSSDDIAAAILDALEELTFTVTADASGCAPLEVSYDPASHTDVAGGTTVSFEETITVPDGTPGGEYTCTVSFLADDTVIGTQEITILVNTAPSCEDAAASSPLLWPPNHKYVDGSILGITDIDGDELTVAITGITSDEPVDAPGMGDGNTSPDAVIGTGNAFQVRAERQGAGDGRVYLVSFTADDGNGGTCTGTASIGVPHDQGGGATPIDSRGTSYDATTP